MRISLREIVDKGRQTSHEDYLAAVKESITLRDTLLKLISGNILTLKSDCSCS